MIKISHAMTTRSPSPPPRKFIIASLVVVAMVGFIPLQAAPNADDLFDARARFQNQKKKIKPSDKNGFFVGLQVLYGDFSYNENHKHKQLNGFTVTDGKGEPIDHRDSGIGYGLLAGYNHWFGKHFGLRVYNSVFYNDFTFESKELSYASGSNTLFTIPGGKNIKTYQINFNANVDVMVNFFFRKNFTAGVFTGASAGIQYWNSSRLEELLGVYNTLQNSSANGNIGGYNKNHQRLDDSRFGLDMAITAGLRANTYGFQSWEIGVRVPIYSRAVLDGETATNTQGAVMHVMNNVIKSRQNWNIFLRYMFNF